MASGIKITGKVKWVAPDKYTDDYYLVWSSPSGRLERIANVYVHFDTWNVNIPDKYKGDMYRVVFDTKREAKAYVERYFGIARKKYSRPKDWHPFGL